jgi:hypothetical protein
VVGVGKRQIENEWTSESKHHPSTVNVCFRELGYRFLVSMIKVLIVFKLVGMKKRSITRFTTLLWQKRNSWAI